MYGGSTPAGGAFATMTSVAMLGILTPFAVVVSNIHNYSSLQDFLRAFDLQSRAKFVLALSLQVCIDSKGIVILYIRPYFCTKENIIEDDCSVSCDDLQ
jgi:hypothetical protein